MTNMSSFNQAMDVSCILGDANTGKTTTLVSKAVELLEGGIPQNRIALFASSPQTAFELHELLSAQAKAAEVDASAVLVGTPRQLALDVLNSEEAFAVTGRKGRILDRAQQAFLFEDLKVSGMRPGRMRKMLDYFYRSWTELADDDPQWLADTEEELLHNLLKDNLNMLQSVLEPEAANLARKVLREALGGRSCQEPSSRDAMGGALFDCVFVDDYQLLSRASQQLCLMAASQTLYIAANPFSCVETYDSYPYAAGVKELLRIFPQAKRFELTLVHQTQKPRTALEHLRTTERLDSMPAKLSAAAVEGSVETLCNNTSDQEFSALAKLVAESLDSESNLSSIVVAAPNELWAARLTATLRYNGIKAHTHEGRQVLRARFDDRKRSFPARMLCALRLVANVEDYAAWRAWCGYDDSMANSAAFAGIRQAALERNLDLGQALEKLAEGALPLKKGSLGANSVGHAWRTGIAMCRDAEGLHGRELLDFLAQRVTGDNSAEAPGILLDMCQLSNEGAEYDLSLTAKNLLERAENSLEGPLAHTDGKVAVLTYREAIGPKADLLIVAGFVNGFIPKGSWFDLTKTPLGKQEKYRVESAQLTAALISAARSQLVLSWFTSADLTAATNWNLKIDRIFMEDGRRKARIGSSLFLNGLGVA